ncbi:MAG: hypothetical protein K6E10_03285 [Eubacterium sp.]|nr:hypothetical protein [Eubacterium sp.]
MPNKGLSVKGRKRQDYNNVRGIQEAFREQKTVQDKIWYGMLLNAYQGAKINNLRDTWIEENEIKAANEQKDVYSIGIKDVFSQDEINVMDDILEDKMFVDVLGDGAYSTIVKNMQKAYLMLPVVMARLADEYENAAKLVPEDEPNRENKIAYIVYNSESMNMQFVQSMGTVIGVSGISSYLQSDSSHKKMVEYLNYNSEMTVSQFMSKLCFSPAEREKFLMTMNCGENNRIYDVFEKKYIKNHPDDPKPDENTIISEIEAEYIYYVDSRLNAAEISMRSNTISDIKNSMTADEKKKFERGVFIYTGTKIDPASGDEISIVNGSNDKKEKNEFKEWVEKKGNGLIAQYKASQKKKSLNTLDRIVHHRAPFHANEDEISSIFYDNQQKKVDIAVYRGVLNDLLSTKDGGGVGHSKNSEKYEKLINNLKKYEYAVSSREGLKAEALKEKLIDSCMDYIDGKTSRLRRSPWARKRFDDAILLLAELLPEDKFRNIVDGINKDRGAKKGEDNYIDYDKKYARSYEANSPRSKIRNRMRDLEDQVQRDTKENATNMSSLFKAKMQVLDDLFSPEIPDQSVFRNVFRKRSGQPIKGIDNFKKEFKPIGEYKFEILLSDKDFAAISYGACLSGDAAGLDKSLMVASPEETALINGEKYTIDICNKETANNLKDNIEVINKGRNIASDALRDYANGYKEPLSRIIASTMKYIADSTATSDFVGPDYFYKSEISSRMMKMMNRDPELLKLSLKNGLTNDIYTKVKTVQKETEIMARHVDGINKLCNMNSVNKMTDKEYENHQMDIVMKTVLDVSLENGIKSAQSNPDYKKEIKTFTEKCNKEYSEINRSNKPEDRIKKSKLQEVNALRGKLILAKYIPENPLIKTLKNPKEADKLRDELKKFMKKSGIMDMDGEVFSRNVSKTTFRDKVAEFANKYAPVKVERRKQVENISGKSTSVKSM